MNKPVEVKILRPVMIGLRRAEAGEVVVVSPLDVDTLVGAGKAQLVRPSDRKAINEAIASSNAVVLAAERKNAQPGPSGYYAPYRPFAVIYNVGRTGPLH